MISRCHSTSTVIYGMTISQRPASIVPRTNSATASHLSALRQEYRSRVCKDCSDIDSILRPWIPTPISVRKRLTTLQKCSKPPSDSQKTVKIPLDPSRIDRPWGFNSRVHQNMEKPPLRWLFHVLTICEGGELNAALRNTPVGCFSGDRSILRGSRDTKRLMTSQNARATPLGSTTQRFLEHID